MNYLPYVLFAVVVLGLLAFSARARRRQAETEAKRVQRDHRRHRGDDHVRACTASVVAHNDDETVQLSIAPGVEVKWAFAALREVESLPYAVPARGPPSQRRLGRLAQAADGRR